jgi:hypothetical protein
LVIDFTSVDLPPPLLGRPEKLDHLRGLGSLGRLPVPGLRREGVDGLGSICFVVSCPHPRRK